ncbi:para-nitrobenzyl esterase [Grosmannia clavigera kw1407]|uniref:Carboxylic ester hydrolase n=1 Tax=Grosmannia clavigera (strain kw1407 / UAMH 11150) TaxID=655863 RepID=F0XH50_GROCL|nr:para-nitrobenzyl esterase [Grosmannia clavigera kw1407]EFX02769.1 para-nitrobenzyl esterase [Grosmannia clavigera kw1407]
MSSPVAATPLAQLPSGDSPGVLQTVVGIESPVAADLPKCPQPSAGNTSRVFQTYLPYPELAEAKFDCLRLTIVRPSPAALARHGIAPAEASRLPVLVWIHGGGLSMGASSDPMWDTSRLVLRALKIGSPIMVVSINYRLNLFGFAASRDLLVAQQQQQPPVTTAGLNFGLRDQKLGLAWISRNIAAFGGDPDRISISGQSAGSVSVHSHLLEATAAAAAGRKTLFRRAIMLSGALSTLGPIPLELAEAPWKRICDLTLAPSSSPADRVRHLRQLPASTLLEITATNHIQGIPIVEDDITVFLGPSGSSDQPDMDLGPVDLRHAPRQAAQKGVDVLIGFTDVEALIFMGGLPPFAQILSKFEAVYSDRNHCAEVMKAYGLVASATSAELQQGLLTLLSDAMFEVPVHLARKNLQKKSGGPAVGQVQSFLTAVGNPFPGPIEGFARHCVELIYLFETCHTTLVEADRGIRRPYTKPGQENAALPQQDPTMSNGEPYKRSNIELCHEFQDHIICYVTADDWKPACSPDFIMVYGKDRSTEVQSFTDDPAWKQRVQRWELLAERVGSMMQLAEEVRGLSVSVER